MNIISFCIGFVNTDKKLRERYIKIVCTECLITERIVARFAQLQTIAQKKTIMPPFFSVISDGGKGFLCGVRSHSHVFASVMYGRKNIFVKKKRQSICNADSFLS